MFALGPANAGIAYQAATPAPTRQQAEKRNEPDGSPRRAVIVRRLVDLSDRRCLFSDTLRSIASLVRGCGGVVSRGVCNSGSLLDFDDEAFQFGLALALSPTPPFQHG